jgi:hypothetical protein
MHLSRESAHSLLALSYGGLAEIWGESGPHEWSVRSSLGALEETRRLGIRPAPADSLGDGRYHNEPYVFRYNDLAESHTRLAMFRGDSAVALQALAYSDSAFVRRAALRRNWPALGSVLFQRGRAWLAVADLTSRTAAVDSARQNLRRSLQYRGPDRPRVFAETHEALADAGLIEARRAQHVPARVGVLREAIAHLDTAHVALPSVTRPELYARLRSLRADVLIELALAERDPAPLVRAAAALDSNSRVFNYSDLPRHFALDQVRRATLDRVRGTISADTSSWGRARAALSFARDQSQQQGDRLVMRRIERERAALIDATALLRKR